MSIDNICEQLKTLVSDKDKKIQELTHELSDKSSHDRLTAKCQEQEKTIADLTIHCKFTTWIQQTQTQLMQQLLELYQQNQVQTK
jgi:hypothetical protein